MKLFNGNAVFLKFLILSDQLFDIVPYDISALPGCKEGISGSGATGDNIGIVDYINTKENEERKKAAVEALKFITSKEVQKKFFKKRVLIPGIRSLFYDEDACMMAHCDLFQSLQMIGKPSSLFNDYNLYTEKFKEYISEYLYENETAENALKNVENISKIYYISINTKDTFLGLMIFIILIFLITVMILSLIFLFIHNLSPFFEFLSGNCWFLIVIGSIFTISTCFTKYGLLTILKCNLVNILLSFGFTFSFIPVLYKIIICFPIENKFSTWVNEYKLIFLLFFISIDILLNGLLFTTPYQIHTKYIERGKNFQICKMNYKTGIFIILLIIIHKFLITIIISILSFIEWNIEKIVFDVRLIVYAVYINIINTIILFILELIKINNYIYYYLIPGCIIIITSLSNYIFMYGYRIIYGLKNKQNLRQSFIKNINKNFIDNNSTISKQNNNIITYTSKYNDNYLSTACGHDNDNDSDNSRSISSNGKSIVYRIMNYHYLTRSDNITDTLTENRFSNNVFK